MNHYAIWDAVRVMLELIILTYIIYKCLYFLRGTRGAYVLAGIVMFSVVLYHLSTLLGFRVIPDILTYIWQAIVVVLIVIFQPELRRAFAQIGSRAFWRGGNKKRRELAQELVLALTKMSKRKIGALIVLERRIGLRSVVDDAVKLDAKVSAVLLETIFVPNSPLHDGAVLIRGDRIVAARAILPLTRASEISKQLGTRHRAALGISEESDAVTLVVSEETGVISLAGHGALLRNVEPDELEEMLTKLIDFDRQAESKLFKLSSDERRVQNMGENFEDDSNAEDVEDFES